VLLIGSCVVIH